METQPRIPPCLKLCNQDDRALLTKDADFQLAFELGKGPSKLLLVTTGNISNSELVMLFQKNMPAILSELEKDFLSSVTAVPSLCTASSWNVLAPRNT